MPKPGDPGIPKEAPPWFASQEQYESFLKLFAMDLGPQCITATSIGVEHFDEAGRKALLCGYGLRPTLNFVCSTYAALDTEALYSRESAFEKRFVGKLTGDLAVKVQEPLAQGSRLMPPPALNHLIREVIEWCTEPDRGGADLAALSRDDFVRLVLSINGDQEAQQRPDFFTSWPPSGEELDAYNTAMGDDEFLLQELRRQLPYEFARMQTAATGVPHTVLADTYDTWFKGWPEAAPHNLIGDTPEEAFAAATNAPLRDVIRMGLLLWDRTKSGAVAISADSLGPPIAPAAAELLKSSAVLPLNEYRKRLAKERKSGSLAHRRYTFTERPLVEVIPGEYIVLRPLWVLDRFCGSQLYWQTFFGFGTEKAPIGEQFSQAMNYVFEATVGALFRRAARRTRGAITLITEKEMQHAWSSKGNTRSVCDWVLLHGNTCILVDATNHWLDADAAQGFADPDDYQTDLKETFVDHKFKQLQSTMKLLVEHGWGEQTLGPNTIFVPLVVVPNAGIPVTVFADIDIKLQSGQLGANVRAPGILLYHELRVFDGICGERMPNAFVSLLGEWRRACTGPAPMRLQTFLELKGVDRPLGRYVRVAKRLLLDKVGPPIPLSVSNL
ncbi:hypothetical protein A5646_11155 [Mycobacterium sp. 1245499.0]|uniref:hypothetical protein n=1 Tax=Mycobacterium sp. 1245499.0 TaxID=1834074 RepID=UPI0008011F48|nr:hypothetical protein [Mycobacterium sp. 1245499.0]OBL09764.1 hypothetical protein A5646_11155 [Mycobacterium sp. 1245499.0]